MSASMSGLHPGADTDASTFLVGTQDEPQAPAPRRRRLTTSDFLAAQRSRQRLSASQGGDAAGAPGAGAELGMLVPTAEPPATLHRAASGASLAELLGGSHEEVLNDDAVTKQFQEAQTMSVKGLKLAAAQDREKKVVPDDSRPTLIHSEDILNDLSMKTTLKLCTVHTSWRWLLRLPCALRVASSLPAFDTSKTAKAALKEMCEEHLPSLAADLSKAIKWMDRIVACLTWYEIDGPIPPQPSNLGASAQSADERTALRRVQEWDAALRSLETLLRQGLVPTFTIAAERWSVTVLGEGVGPIVCRRTGESKKPSQRAPIAVFCPSVSEFREMLKANHVPFDVAAFADMPDSKAVAGTSVAPSAGAIVPISGPTAPGNSTAAQDISKEMRELQRDGIPVAGVAGGSADSAVPDSTALWFEGAWRVHALLDVLRQHFLGAPLSSGRASPKQLPRLVSPAPFLHATARMAEVVHTVSPQSSPGTWQEHGSSAPQNSAELSGRFFPGQVKRLLELLRVLLPSFSCEFGMEPTRNKGINAFTRLGNYHIEAVECERLRTGKDDAFVWSWGFKLGTEA